MMLPSSASMLQQAIHWRVRLESGQATAAEQRACEEWRQADPRHEQMWQRLEQMSSPFRGPAQDSAGLVRATLEHTDAVRRQMGRRRALRMLAGSLAGLSTAGLLMHHQGTFERLRSDLTTPVGQRSRHTLADHSTLWLNTDTAVALNWPGPVRQLTLHRGEVHLHTAQTEAPFQIRTRRGQLNGQGSVRFLLRDAGDHLLLELQQGRLEMAPRLAALATDLVPGTLYRVTDTDLAPLPHNGFDYSAWTAGLLSARDMPLGELLQEIGRYRHGLVRCHPGLAERLVSGVYQLPDTDLMLQTLAHATHSQVRYMTRWWAELRPIHHA